MLRTIVLLTLICLLPNPGHAANTDTPTGPKAYLADSVYQFPPILEGLEVIHEFVILNKGDEPLNILKVKSG